MGGAKIKNISGPNNCKESPMASRFCLNDHKDFVVETKTILYKTLMKCMLFHERFKLISKLLGYVLYFLRKMNFSDFGVHQANWDKKIS